MGWAGAAAKAWVLCCPGPGSQLPAPSRRKAAATSSRGPFRPRARRCAGGPVKPGAARRLCRALGPGGLPAGNPDEVLPLTDPETLGKSALALGQSFYVCKMKVWTRSFHF